MAAGMSAAGSSRFSEPRRRSGAASLVAWSLFLPDELPRPVAVLPGRRRLHALQPAENRQIRCRLVGIRSVDTRRRLGSISGRTLCLAPRVNLPEAPSRLFPSCRGLGVAADLLFGFAPGLLFHLLSGFGFGGAACLLLGFAPGLLFGFAPSSFVGLSSGFGFGGAACLLFGFAPGLGFGFAPCLGCFGFAPG